MDVLLIQWKTFNKFKTILNIKYSVNILILMYILDKQFLQYFIKPKYLLPVYEVQGNFGNSKKCQPNFLNDLKT